MYGVVAVSWVSAYMPAMIGDQAERHDPAHGELVGQRARDRHRAHRAEALHRHQPAGLERGLTAHLLEVGRHEEQPAEERGGEQEHRDDRDA